MQAYHSGVARATKAEALRIPVLALLFLGVAAICAADDAETRILERIDSLRLMPLEDGILDCLPAEQVRADSWPWLFAPRCENRRRALTEEHKILRSVSRPLDLRVHDPQLTSAM